MQLNTAKKKMLQGQPAMRNSLGMGSPIAAELLARCGIDWLMLETQHGSWGNDGAIAALIAMTGGRRGADGPRRAERLLFDRQAAGSGCHGHGRADGGYGGAGQSRC